MSGTISEIGLLDDEEIELDLAALALSEADHDGVEIDLYLAALEGFEDRLRLIGAEAETPEAQAIALARLFYMENGFLGDAASYDAPLNADLIRVLDRKRGLPVSLSILYVAMARRLGWAAYVLNTPGHVLVRVGDDGFVVIDPFHGGVRVGEAEIGALIRKYAGPDARFLPEYLQPVPNRTILIRLLQNQASRAEAAKDPQRALALYSRMSQIAPGYPDVWWQLARLQLHLHDIAGARHSLLAMLEVTRDPIRRRQVQLALQTIEPD